MASFFQCLSRSSSSISAMSTCRCSPLAGGLRMGAAVNAGGHSTVSFFPAARARASHGRRHIFNLAAAAAASVLGPQSSAPPHTLATARTLPYDADALFGIIADVDAYSSFLPHCAVSRVTHWRPQRPVSLAKDETQGGDQTEAEKAWPARADLTVGWGPLSQTYSSRVYCLPSRGVVEAVSGRAAVSTLTAAERTEIGVDEEADQEQGTAQKAARGKALVTGAEEEDDTFESLVTRWTVSPVPAPGSLAPGSASASTATTATATTATATATPWTRVELRIRFQFTNPLYQIAAEQLGNEMATKMIEAFEKRAESLLGPARPGKL